MTFTKYLIFAPRLVDGHTGLALNPSDFFDDHGTFVEKVENLQVDFIDARAAFAERLYRVA